MRLGTLPLWVNFRKLPCSAKTGRISLFIVLYKLWSLIRWINMTRNKVSTPSLSYLLGISLGRPMGGQCGRIGLNAIATCHMFCSYGDVFKQNFLENRNVRHLQNYLGLVLGKHDSL
jgi:hypothetical protein